MKVSYIRKSGPEYITGALRATSGKDMYSLVYPSLGIWKKLLNTTGGVPHSPIRAVEYRIYIEDIPSYCTVHLARHHIGTQPYIKSQRDDRVKDNIPRKDKSQTELINMILDINANAILTIAKARLCNQADKETRKAIQLLKDCFLKSNDTYDQKLGEYMKPSCEWYGKCFEIKPCRREKCIQ